MADNIFSDDICLVGISLESESPFCPFLPLFHFSQMRLFLFLFIILPAEAGMLSSRFIYVFLVPVK